MCGFYVPTTNAVCWLGSADFEGRGHVLVVTRTRVITRGRSLSPRVPGAQDAAEEPLPPLRHRVRVRGVSPGRRGREDTHQGDSRGQPNHLTAWASVVHISKENSKTRR